MSDEQTIKIKLKTGHMEIEYEGSEDFLRSNLLDLITQIAETYKVSSSIGTPHQLTNTPEPGTTQGNTPTINLSVKSIAAKLNVTTGTELALVACVYLTLVAKRDTFSRKDILDSMKDATTFYKKSYAANLSKYLNGLVKYGKILEQANDIYALSGQLRSEMELKLGN